MAEQVMTVCDVCGKAAQQTIAIRVGAKGYAKDLCATHLSELLQGARAPKRGRPRMNPAEATVDAPKTTPSVKRRRKLTPRRPRSKAVVA